MWVILTVPKPGAPAGLRKQSNMRKYKTMEERNMSVISMKQLLEAGVHFGLGFLMFACAAASLAIGTRKGEQET